MNGFIDPRVVDTHKNVGPLDVGPMNEEDKLLIEWIRANLPKNRPDEKEEGHAGEVQRRAR